LLEDYLTAFLLTVGGGVDDELFIIQFLPLYLADNMRA
jgi:hypothetical protein